MPTSLFQAAKGNPPREPGRMTVVFYVENIMLLNGFPKIWDRLTGATSMAEVDAILTRAPYDPVDIPFSPRYPAGRVDYELVADGYGPLELGPFEEAPGTTVRAIGDRPFIWDTLDGWRGGSGAVLTVDRLLYTAS